MVGAVDLLCARFLRKRKREKAAADSVPEDAEEEIVSVCAHSGFC